MAKMTREQLKKRKAELRIVARQQLSKTEVMRFRLDPDNIISLCKIAERKKMNLGAMVRDWVLERMRYELGSKTSSHMTALTFDKFPGNQSLAVDTELLTNIMQRLSRLEATAPKQHKKSPSRT
jgi:hypothetical protein